MMHQEVIPAIYENGVIRPLKPLQFPDHQQMQIIIVSEGTRTQPGADRLRGLHEAVDLWQAQQAHSIVREPKHFEQQEQAALDVELDQLLAEIHRYTQADSEEELAALIDEAVAAVRAVN